MSLCNRWSCPLHYEVHRATCLCCCRRPEAACRSLGPAGKPADGLLTGLGNGRHQLLKTRNRVAQNRCKSNSDIQQTSDAINTVSKTANLLTRLQLFRLHLRLLHRMLRLAVEGLVVAVLVLAGLVQSLCLTSWRDRGVEVEHLRGWTRATLWWNQNQRKGHVLVRS